MTCVIKYCSSFAANFTKEF